MRKIGWIVILGFTMNGWAQNLELNSGKDIRQPGKINPALAGIQEDLIRILSDAEVGQSYQLMLEGHIPFNIGNFMIGAERTFTDDVSNDMFNFTYARRKKRKDKNIIDRKDVIEVERKFDWGGWREEGWDKREVEIAMVGSADMVRKGLEEDLGVNKIISKTDFCS